MIPVGRILEWLVEQKGIIAFVLALMLFTFVLVMRFAYNTWWPAGIVLATILGLIAVVNSRT
jgi:uncharacterized membrane protein YcfT